MEDLLSTTRYVTWSLHSKVTPANNGPYILACFEALDSSQLPCCSLIKELRTSKNFRLFVLSNAPKGFMGLGFWCNFFILIGTI